MDFHFARTLANLSLLLYCLHLRSLHFDIWVTMDINGCRCGQNISSVVRTQLQLQVVTLRRVYVVAVAVWLLGIGNAILAIIHQDAAKVVSVLEITVCLITSFSCYIRIFFRLRHQQTQVHNNSPHQEIQTIPLNFSQYRKTVSIAVLLQLTFVFCYLPYLLLVQFARREIENKQSPSFYFLLYSTITLVFVNSSLNPILFCWKIKEVRHAVKDMLRCRGM